MTYKAMINNISFMFHNSLENHPSPQYKKLLAKYYCYIGYKLLLVAGLFSSTVLNGIPEL